MALYAVVPYGTDRETRRVVWAEGVERGLRCGAVCPICDEALVAKQGEVKAWHFAHQSESKNVGGGCGESLLHKAAKEAVAGLAPSGRNPKGGVIHLGRHGNRFLFRVKSARTEYSLRESARQVDLALAVWVYAAAGRGKSPWRYVGSDAVVLEIVVSNPKDRGFCEEMGRLGIPAYEMELDVGDVLRRRLKMHNPPPDLAGALRRIVQVKPTTALWERPAVNLEYVQSRRDGFLAVGGEVGSARYAGGDVRVSEIDGICACGGFITRRPEQGGEYKICYECHLEGG